MWLMGGKAAGRVQTHRHPADLGPQIPEVKCGRGTHGQLLQNVLILQGLALCREAGQGSGTAQAFAHCHQGAQGQQSRWLYLLGSRRRDWRAGYHCGSVDKAGRHSTQTARDQGPHTPPASDKASVACVAPGQGQKERRQKQDVFLPKFQQGSSCRWPHGGAATGKPREVWATLGASLWAERRGLQKGSHPEPQPRGAAGDSVAGPWTYGS